MKKFCTQVWHPYFGAVSSRQISKSEIAKLKGNVYAIPVDNAKFLYIFAIYAASLSLYVTCLLNLLIFFCHAKLFSQNY